MRTALRWLLSLVVLVGTVGAGTATAEAAPAAEPDIKDRILAIRGMSLIEEKPVDGYRFFVLNYTQPIDHRHPSRGTFEQRLTLLHKSQDRPTVFFTSGYNVNTTPRRSEPTQIVDGNQVSLEYRFFTPSRPEPADWSKLDIWQAASDQHRVYRALKRVYAENWISTGGSKGGMTATYYRRFFPDDMDGTVAYVAPNDVDNAEDSAYDRFFRTVGTARCRADLAAIEREALLRRDEMVDRYRKWADAEKQTFRTVGDADKAYEVLVTDLVFGFWQYQDATSACAQIPAPDASSDALWKWMDTVGGFDSYTDQGLEPYTPYYYQAGTQLGEPGYAYPNVEDLLRYPGINNSRSFVPKDIPMRFQKNAMRDIDRWVRHDAERMMFVNGQFDPWGSEPFRLGSGSKDSYVYKVPGGNHGSNIAKLQEDDRVKAVRSLLKWADVEVAPGGRVAPLAPYDKKLDRREIERLPVRLP